MDDNTRQPHVTDEAAAEAGRYAVDRLLGERNKAVRRAESRALLALVLALVFGGAYVARTFAASVEPYPVAVDPQGRATFYGPVEPLKRTDERVVRAELAKFIYYVRTVSTDAAMQKDLLTRGYAYTTTNVGAQIDGFLSLPENDPRLLGLNGTREVIVESLLPVEGEKNLWLVRWREVDTPRTGGAPGVASWEGSLKVEFGRPPKDNIERNPLGIYVSSLNWTRINTRTSR